MRSAREDQHAQQHDDHRAADEADFLARDAEDEVGLLVGHEIRGDQLAVQQASAQRAARANHDLGVDRLVPGSPTDPPPDAGKQSAGPAG